MLPFLGGALEICLITKEKRKKRLEGCTLWSTPKFQRCSLCHTTDNDVIKATKGITNKKTVSKATMISKIIVAII
jgi:hypothetical protein